MNVLIKERHNHSKNCITLKVSRRTQKVEIYFSKDAAGAASFSTDLEDILGSIIGNECEMMLRKKRPDKRELLYHIVCLLSLIINTDLIEISCVGDTKVLVLRCFLFISKLRAGDVITTGQCLNYQTFSNLQLRPVLKTSFHNTPIDFRCKRGDKNPFVPVGITRLVLMFGKASNIQL